MLLVAVHLRGSPWERTKLQKASLPLSSDTYGLKAIWVEKGLSFSFEVWDSKADTIQIENLSTVAWSWVKEMPLLNGRFSKICYCPPPTE